MGDGQKSTAVLFVRRLTVEHQKHSEVMFTTGYWRQLAGTLRVLGGLVIQEVGDLLSARPPRERDEEKDNAIFRALTAATVEAIRSGQFQFAITLFRQCLDLVRRYEKATSTEVHKGAMAFNVALAYLHANDFPAAMHHLQFAQIETRKTRGDSGWEIFGSDLFRVNFWEGLDRYEEKFQLALYGDFWLTAFGSASATRDWKNLSENSKLLYIVVNAERISYSRLNPEPDMPVSEGFSLAYWNLIADLSRILETEFRHRKLISGKESLLTGVLQKVNGPIAQFGKLANSHFSGHTVGSPADFNTHFSYYHQCVQDQGATRDSRIAAAAVLAGVTRNQVQHQVDRAMVTFTTRRAAVFTADVLLCLCNLDSWAQS